MDKKVLDKNELTDKLSNQAVLLTDNKKVIEEQLIDFRNLINLLTKIDEKRLEIDKLNNLLKDYHSKEEELLNTKEVIGKEIEAIKSVSKELLTEYQNKDTNVTSLNEKVLELENLVISLDNDTLRAGYEEEVKKLDNLRQELSDISGKLNEQKDNLESVNVKLSKNTVSLNNLKASILQANDKIKSINEEIVGYNRQIHVYKSKKVNVDVVNVLVEVAKKFGALEYMANNTVEETHDRVQQAIDIVVNNTSKEVPKFTKEFLYDLFIQTFEGKDKCVLEDNREVLVCNLANVSQKIRNKYNIIDVYFDDFVDNPTILGNTNKLYYLTVANNKTSYSNKCVNYYAKKHYPVIYRVFSYILNGIKETNKLTYLDLVNRLNSLVEQESNKFKLGSYIESNSNYLFCEKGGDYIPVAVNSNSLIAVPVECYTYEFLAVLANDFGYEISCKCKKGGRFGYDK